MFARAVITKPLLSLAEADDASPWQAAAVSGFWYLEFESFATQPMDGIVGLQDNG